MNVLIVESQSALAHIWKRHIERLGGEIWLATNHSEAIDLLNTTPFDVIVLDLILDRGCALAVSDLAEYRQPSARVVFVTNTSFFSDGSIFRHCSNACAFLPSSTEPSDLATMVEHYAKAS